VNAGGRAASHSDAGRGEGEVTGLQTLALYEASAPAVIDEIAHGRPAQIRALVSRGMLATRLIEVTLDLDRDAVHFLATVERWPAGDKKSRIAGFDLLLVPAGAEARMGGLAYHSRARVAGPSEGRVFPAVDAWRHFCETHVFFLPICLDQPTDVGEDATTDAEVRP